MYSKKSFKIPKGGNQNPYISKKNRQHNGKKIPKGQSESVYRGGSEGSADINFY